MISTESYMNDDIYGGYNEYSSIYSTKNLEDDLVFQEAIQIGNLKRNIVRLICIVFKIFY